MKNSWQILSLAGFFAIGGLSQRFLLSGDRSLKNPVVQELETGERLLVLPTDLTDFLSKEFPGYKLPKESDFNPAMLRYYHSQLIGVHPAVTWGDFNNDKKKDYALLLITSDTPWGPLTELVVLNGEKKNGVYKVYRIGEIYGLKDDYVSFENEKLYKGRFQKGGWYINWDPKNQNYIKLKS